MILVLYAYGGWNDAAFVTAEVRNRSRNIPLALLYGLGLIVIIYVLVNLAYLRALGFEGLRNSQRPAADALSAALGEHCRSSDEPSGDDFGLGWFERTDPRGLTSSRHRRC